MSMSAAYLRTNAKHASTMKSLFLTSRIFLANEHDRLKFGVGVVVRVGFVCTI